MAKAVKKKVEASRADRARSAQERFLLQLAQERRKVAVFLTNGIKLEGEIKSFDEYTILIEGTMTDHVYKHAVSTIQPLTGVAAKAQSGNRNSRRASRIRELETPQERQQSSFQARKSGAKTLRRVSRSS